MPGQHRLQIAELTPHMPRASSEVWESLYGKATPTDVGLNVYTHHSQQPKYSKPPSPGNMITGFICTNGSDLSYKLICNFFTASILRWSSSSRMKMSSFLKVEFTTIIVCEFRCCCSLGRYVIRSWFMMFVTLDQWSIYIILSAQTTP